MALTLEQAYAIVEYCGPWSDRVGVDDLRFLFFPADGLVNIGASPVVVDRATGERDYLGSFAPRWPAWVDTIPLVSRATGQPVERPTPAPEDDEDDDDLDDMEIGTAKDFFY